MGLLNRPSRSYKDVDHNADGLSAVGSAPYGGFASMTTIRSGKNHKKDSASGSDKFRPSYAELHFKRQATDTHPGSSFSPLPPAFQLGRKNKEQARAGQRAELDHILEPGYKTASIYGGDDDAASVAGPSRLSSVRTAGGLGAALGRRKDDSLRPSAAIANSGRDGRKGLGGVYVDSTGRVHDTEYDPFAGVSEMSRRKSRRRSAFGGHRRASASSASGSGSSDESDVPQTRTSVDARLSTEEEKEREEIKRRLEVERRRLDEVSGYAAARRKSMMSDRASGFMSNGRSTPSIRSGNEDGMSVMTGNGTVRGTSRLGHHGPSPLSPAGAETNHHRSTSNVSGSSGRPRGNSSAAGNDESPRKHTEHTPPEAPEVDKPPPPYKRVASLAQPPQSNGSAVEDESEDEFVDAQEPQHRIVQPDVLVTKPVKKSIPGDKRRVETITTIKTAKVLPPAPKQTVERAPDGATKITGFDAGPPRTPVFPQSVASVASRMTVPESVLSHGSSRSSERDPTREQRRTKPAERPREQLFPETPAQAKRREEKERRNLRVGRTPAGTHTSDTVASSSRSRVLPEIEFVDDDDPRIVFPPNGASTRVQTHEHVIRSSIGNRPDYSGPTSLVGMSARDRERYSGDAASGLSGRGDSNRSLRNNESTKATSIIIEETGGGYVPSRWASGDRKLRVTGEEKAQYRPIEWGGRHGDLGGRTDEWRPDAKDQLKRNMKDLSTNARFSVFRAKKKILRKAEI